MDNNGQPNWLSHYGQEFDTGGGYRNFGQAQRQWPQLGGNYPMVPWAGMAGWPQTGGPMQPQMHPQIQTGGPGQMTPFQPMQTGGPSQAMPFGQPMQTGGPAQQIQQPRPRMPFAAMFDRMGGRR